MWGGAPLSLLRDVAARMGADVPFFLSGGTALGLGRGEEIYPLVDLPVHWVVIVRPPYGVSTAEAYAWYDEDRAAGMRETRELQILPVPWPTRAAQMINDLEPPVVRRHPEIGRAQDDAARSRALSRRRCPAAVLPYSDCSGAGPAAARVVARLARSGAQAILTKTMTRGEHERGQRSGRSSRRV